MGIFLMICCWDFIGRNSLEVYDLDSRFHRDLKVPVLGVSLLANVGNWMWRRELRAGT